MTQAHNSVGPVSSLLWRTGLLAIIATGLCPALDLRADDLAEELKATGMKIVYESYQNGNWDLFMTGLDGQPPVNLTKTPGINEMYPKVSPDGSKLAFVVDEGAGEATVRSVYYMNIDGSGRTLVAKGGRWPCWTPDGRELVYLKQAGERFAYNDPYTQGIITYDLASGRHQPHTNPAIEHIYNPCCSLDCKWFFATVSGGMGYKHTNLALEADGPRVVDLGLPGCRPDLSPDGKRIAWGASDWTLRVGDLDFSGPAPKVVNTRDVVISAKPIAVYHVDWSPDGRYLAFSRGEAKKQIGMHPAIVGIQAAGWNICVADAAATNRWTAITTDGHSNKEPDWMPLPAKAR